jgi:hypothetical protein
VPSPLTSPVTLSEFRLTILEGFGLILGEGDVGREFPPVKDEVEKFPIMESRRNRVRNFIPIEVPPCYNSSLNISVDEKT